jgi:alanine-glyoxylate transaminase / serine-glyoxylate transaminase / serine-pyruvate transaminase
MKGKTLLMIPGPIEFDLDVLEEMGKPTSSHVDPDFIEVFGKAIENLRPLFNSPDGQPFIVAGSGTLGMDMAAANLVEPGDAVLLVNSGYFGDRMKDILERYGAQVTSVLSPIGGIPELDEVEAELKRKSYKLMTLTHVDTSTGVLNKIEEFTRLAKKYNVLVIVDGVCSVAAEDLNMQAWGVDVAFTASQKAVGVPPGLALLVASPAAMKSFKSRKTPVSSYYADWNNWLPIMEAYENRKAAYFGTPAVNLVNALQVSLEKILAEGLQPRLMRHQRISNAFKDGMSALGLKQVPLQPDLAANTMSALYYPETIKPADFLAAIREAGVVLAGGLHPEIKNYYFRIGHMGAIDLGDIMTTIAAIETGLSKSGYAFEAGTGVNAALKSYLDK